MSEDEKAQIRIKGESNENALAGDNGWEETGGGGTGAHGRHGRDAKAASNPWAAG